jgi:signal transduction histidine kinase
VTLDLKMARRQIEQEPAAGIAMLDQAIAHLAQATAELREFARGVHPVALTEGGLEAALPGLARRAGLPVKLHGVPADRLPATVEATAYFLVSEALTNVARYARATRADVRIEREPGALVVQVSDDGAGGADPARGSGLRGLADRLAALDGTLQVHSPVGAGTRVTAVIPCAS